MNQKTEIKKLTNLENLCTAIYRDKKHLDPDHDLDFIRGNINETFVIGYEGWIDGECKGWAYSLNMSGIYTLDGHNEGVSVFFASKLGKLVMEDLFKGHTDLVVTAHNKDDQPLNALAKRTGFKFMTTYEDKILFYKVK